MMNKRPLMDRINEKIDKTGSCWKWTGALDSNGYGSIMLTNKALNLRTAAKVCRILWETLNGPVPEGKYVLHKCDVRACVNPDHLYIGTPSNNMQDMWDRGRHPKPKLHAVMNIQDVLEMRKRYDQGESMKHLAKHFGYRYKTVWAAVRGVNWRVGY